MNKKINLFVNVIVIACIVGLITIGVYAVLDNNVGLAYVSFVAAVISLIRTIFDPYKD